MDRLLHRRSKKTGLPPGTLVHIGEKRIEKVRISITRYDGDAMEEREAESFEECVPFKAGPGVTWISVTGIHKVENVERIGECFGIHPLTLEDVLNTEQRPKIEEYDEYVFVVLKMIYLDEEGGIDIEQVSLVLGASYVISFQESEKDVFGPVRERIRAGKARIRKLGADFLAYSLLDAVVDSYFLILEKAGERIEEVEEELVERPSPETL